MDLNSAPHLNALAQALASGLAPSFSKMESALADVCSAVKQSAANSAAANGAANGHDHSSTGSCCSSCKAGGQCEDGCPLGPNPIMNQLPSCYGNCKTMSKCLQEYMRTARTLLDDGAWMEYQKSEIPLVHVNTLIGAAPNYQATFPLGTNQNIMLMQEALQVLPYEPGLLKVDPQWNGTPAPAEVTVNIYTGTDAVTSVTSTPIASGLIQIGRSMNLGDFECKDDCYLLGFPDVFGCDIGAIPFRRRVFVELRGGAMGASQLTGLNFTIIKRSTKKFVSLCRQFDLVA